MLIREFVEPQDDSAKLLAIATLLSDRASDTAAKKQISQDAFIQLARSAGVNVTPENLGSYISRDPLKNVLEPLEPNSGVVRFKGNTETTTGMNAQQAQDVVDRNAKSAMRRGLKNS